jgi:hypothetical protein
MGLHADHTAGEEILPQVLYNAANLDLYESVVLDLIPPPDDDDACTESGSSLEEDTTTNDEDYYGEDYYGSSDIQVTVCIGKNALL